MLFQFRVIVGPTQDPEESIIGSLRLILWMHPPTSHKDSATPADRAYGAELRRCLGTKGVAVELKLQIEGALLKHRAVECVPGSAPSMVCIVSFCKDD